MEALASTKYELLTLDTLEYRGFFIKFQYDPVGQFVFTTDYPTVNSPALNFGVHNHNYIEDIKQLIDNRLDTIAEFPKFPGSRLYYFNNAGYRDIKLVYRKRLLHIYLYKESQDISDIIHDAEIQLCGLTTANSEKIDC